MTDRQKLLDALKSVFRLQKDKEDFVNIITEITEEEFYDLKP